MTYGSIIIVIIVVLVIANLIARSSRNRGSGSFEDEYYKPARGREAPSSAHRWEGHTEDWGARINRIDAKLETIKSQVDEPAPPPAQPDHDFSGLSESRRKIESQKYLNLHRGKTVLVYTQDNTFKGEVATVTASKVMLRQPGLSEVTAINLDDIWGVS